jgi:hypothetical protein
MTLVLVLKLVHTIALSFPGQLKRYIKKIKANALKCISSSVPSLSQARAFALSF